jgi:1-phosphofructokinase family hexose kinase
MIVCVALSPSVDKTFAVDALVRGAIHRPRAFAQVPGGKGLNVARAVAALGADVRAVAPLGGHAGRWVAAALAAEGVPCTLVPVPGETRASLSVAADGELTEFYEATVALAPAAWGALIEATGSAAKGASWVIVSGSPPPGAGLGALIAAARAQAAEVALDAHGAALADGLAARPDLVKVNREEAAEVTGAVASPAEAATALRAITGGAVVVTDGTAGAALVTAGAALTGKGDTVGAYPVGSGDACLAGLVTALDAGASWSDALRLGLGAAAANAERLGAGRLDQVRARALAARAVLADPDR